MRIQRSIWLDNIIEKLINKHNVRQIEVHEVFLNQPIFRFIEKGHAYGQTASQRYLIVFFVNKKGNQALIISAKNMTEKEKNYYAEKKKFNF